MQNHVGLRCRWVRSLSAALLACAIAAPARAELQFQPPDLIVEPIPRDIKIEDFTVSVPPGSEFLMPDDDVSVDFELVTSVPFTVFGKPSFDARVTINRSSQPDEDAFELGAVTVMASEVRFRGVWEFVWVKKQFSLPLNTPEFRAWAAQQFPSNDQWFVRIDVDTANTVHEGLGADGVFANVEDVAILERPRPLSGDLHFGPTTAVLNHVNAVDGGPCGIDRIQLISGTTATWTPSANGQWLDVDFPVITLCTVPQLDGNAWDLAAAPGQTTQSMITTGYMGTNLAAVLFRLTDLGAVVAGMISLLPDGHSVHVPTVDPFDSTRIMPRPAGRAVVPYDNVGPSPTHDFGNLTATSNGGYFLQANDLPFSIGVVSMTLTQFNLTGEYGLIHYVYDVPWSKLDRRALHRTGPHTNDRRFDTPKPMAGQTSFDFAITANGLAMHGDFEGGSGRSHFPRMWHRWTEFGVEVEDGSLVDQQTLGGDGRYHFSMLTDCGDCTDAESASRPFELGAKNREGLGMDGAMLAVVESDQEVAWGPGSTDGGSKKPVFHRTGDAGKLGVVGIPGFRALGTEGVDGPGVPTYLLGMRRAVDDGDAYLPSTHYLLTHSQSRRGNYFGPGLTMGPWRYRWGIEKQPEIGLGTNLTGSITRIGFGGPPNADWRNVIANVGTKYIVRRGGVTGAFNTLVAPQPQVYGYDMSFRRFAFRMAANVLDDFSWIDGQVTIPGRGDFEIGFSSLELECTGHIGSGHVDAEDCEADPPINCDQAYGAWRAPMEITGMEFIAQPPSAVCAAGDRELRVDSTVDVYALTDRIGLAANWSPTGNPSSARISGKTKNELDKPSGDRGFKVQIAENVQLSYPGGNTTKGWFTLDGLVPVPFWNALDTTIRVENHDLGTAQHRQTIVVPKGNTIGNWSNDTNEELIFEMADSASAEARAKYTWGSTSFGVDLPVRYDAGRHLDDEKPQFIGKMDPVFDIKIMTAQAGVNYVNPDKTQFSFGASADIERLALADVDLHLDLNDPQSVARADQFISQVAGSEITPVANVVGAIRGAFSTVLEISGAGLDDFIEKGIREGFEPFMVGVLNPLADKLNQIHTIPTQAASLVFDELRGGVDTALQPLTDHLDAVAVAIYVDVPERIEAASQFVLDGNPVPPNLKDAMLEDVDRLDGLLTSIGIVKAQFETVSDGIANARDTLDGLESQANTLASQADTALAQAINLLNGNFPVFSCDNLSLDPSQIDNLVLKRIAQVRKVVNDVTHFLKNLQLVQFVSAIASIAGIDLSAIESAQRDIRDLAVDIAGRVNGAVDQMKTALNCGGGGPFAPIADKATAFLTDIRTQVNQVPGIVSTVNTALQPPLNFLELLIAESMNWMGTLEQAVGSIKQELEGLIDEELGEYPNLTANEIRQAMDDFMSEIQPDLKWYYPAGGDPEHSFVSEVADRLREPIDNFIGIVASVTADLLSNVISKMSFPTPEQVREYLVNLIMNSPVVEQIDQLFHQNFVFVLEDLTDLSSHMFDQVNNLLQDLIEQIEDVLNEALSAANSVVKEMPMVSANMDGYAIVAGNELERMHIDAEWTMSGGSDDNTSSYNAALDVTSWSANGKDVACDPGDSSSNLDAVVSTRNLPIDVGGAEIMIKKLFVGFTLRGVNLAPIGVFGGIDTEGELDFKAFQLYDIGFQAGVGKFETYVGAKAGAVFEDIQMQAAFLVGRTCNIDVLASIDPQVAEFIELPEGVFAGGYVRGGASIPVWSNGCFLTIGVGADAGAWVLIGQQGLKIGGLVGGSAWGKALCIASLRGGILVMGDVYDGKFSFRGEGYGVAGLGFDCDPSTWTSISRSRKDSWCGTGDASFAAEYKNGWNVGGLHTSAIH